MQPNNIVYEQRRIVLDGSDTQTDADITGKEGYRAKAQGADGLTLREKRGGDGRLAGAQRPSATPPPDNVDSCVHAEIGAQEAGVRCVVFHCWLAD